MKHWLLPALLFTPLSWSATYTTTLDLTNPSGAPPIDRVVITWETERSEGEVAEGDLMNYTFHVFAGQNLVHEDAVLVEGEIRPLPGITNYGFTFTFDLDTESLVAIDTGWNFISSETPPALIYDLDARREANGQWWVYLDEYVEGERTRVTWKQFIQNTLVSSASNPWPSAERDESGWMHSDWFGWWLDGDAPWYYHVEHGWIYTSGGNEIEGFHYYDLNLACWLWTRKEHYNWLYAYPPISDWLFYSPAGTPGMRWFHRASNSTWYIEEDLLMAVTSP